MVVEDNLWTLENPITTSRMGSLSASTATNMDDFVIPAKTMEELEE